MAIDLYWGSGSAYCWRVQLALEHKGLAYNSHLLKLDQQEHQAPAMLALNPRGRVPVLRDGDYVVFESVAILYYLDLKYPNPPIFGRTVPAGEDIPPNYANLLDWYREWNKDNVEDRIKNDPLLALRGSGKHIWADEHADEYIRRLREGWE